MEGYYKYVNCEWTMAPNGIILPYTTEATMDPVVLNENGWYWYDEQPTHIPDETTTE